MATVMELLEKHTKIEGSTSGEQRDLLLGRCFGLLSVSRSGLLSKLARPQADQVASTIVSQWIKLFQKKTWLQEMAVLGVSELSAFTPSFKAMVVEELLPDSVEDYNAHHLQLAVVIGHLNLDDVHVKDLVPALKQGCDGVRPHLVWKKCAGLGSRRPNQTGFVLGRRGGGSTTWLHARPQSYGDVVVLAIIGKTHC